MQAIFDKLFAQIILSPEESQKLFNEMIKGQLSDIQLSAALTALKIKGESPNEIAGAAKALLAAAAPFPRPNYAFADIVGTGGDNAQSINISTSSAIIAAAMGYKIAKHGNQSVSSLSGASDVLNNLGVPIDLPAPKMRQLLDTHNLCFLFAPHYHSGVKHAMTVRQALKTRTIFNVLGPLINPAHPNYMLMGVYDAALLDPIAKTLQQLNYERVMVVHCGGLDEVALHAPTQVAELHKGQIHHYTLTPDDFDLPPVALHAIRGGKPQDNAVTLKTLLSGDAPSAHQYVIAANVALVMQLFGEENLSQNVRKILDFLNTKQAIEFLNHYIEYANQLGNSPSHISSTLSH